MPVDAAGHGPPPRPPRAGPGAGEAGDPAAPAWAGDNTRSGGTGELAAPADPARSPVPDPGRRTAPRITGSSGPGPAGHGRLGPPDADTGSVDPIGDSFPDRGRQVMATDRNGQFVIGQLQSARIG